MAGKDLVAGRAWAAAGRDHAALFSGAALVGAPQWVAGAPPPDLAAGRPLHCQFKARCGAQTASACAASISLAVYCFDQGSAGRLLCAARMP